MECLHLGSAHILLFINTVIIYESWTPRTALLGRQCGHFVMRKQAQDSWVTYPEKPAGVAEPGPSDLRGSPIPWAFMGGGGRTMGT